MKRCVHPSRIDGAVAAPPSKSVMLRVTAAALLAGEERSTIENPTLCEDALAGFRAAEALGATVEVSPGVVAVTGGLNPRESVLFCGESCLCVRMFTPIAALTGAEIVLSGDRRLLRRPTTTIEGPMTALGAWCRTTGGSPPIHVRGPLKGGKAVVDGAVSSQFLSGLLLALPLLETDSELLVRNLASRPYVDLTIAMLDRFGVAIERDGYERFTIPGGQRPVVGNHRVEGDWSAAAFLLVAGALGGRVRVTGLDPDSHQADRRILEVLERAGAAVTRHADAAEVRADELRAFEFDTSDSPDLFPPLAALACHCRGTTVLRGASRLRHKECDRIDAAARELTTLGVRISVRDDVVEIEGGRVRGGEVSSHGDHRIAMTLAAAAVRAEGPVRIEGAENVAKSYPRFFEDLAAVGGEVHDREMCPSMATREA